MGLDRIAAVDCRRSRLDFCGHRATGGALQIWTVKYPDGSLRRITNDLSNYGGGDPIELTSEAASMAQVSPDGKP